MRLPDILLTRIQAVRVAIRGETTLLLVVFNDSPLPVHHVQSELYHFRNHSTSCRETFTLYPARLVVISIVVRCCQTRSYSKESGFVEKRGSMSSVSSCGTFSHPRCSLLRRRASREVTPVSSQKGHSLNTITRSHNRALKGDNTSTIATHTTSRPSPHSHPLHPISPSCPPHLILLSTSGKSRRSRQTKQRPLTRQTLPSRRRK
jgi:hypothetical protein